MLMMEVDTSVAAAEPSVRKVAFVLCAAVRDRFKCWILSFVIWARRCCLVGLLAFIGVNFYFFLAVHDKTCDVHTVVEAAAVVDELVGGLSHDNQADNSQNGVDDCEYKVAYVDDGFDWG
jgi:uncharacterized membrane protein YjfL (UPF0719 family)